MASMVKSANCLLDLAKMRGDEREVTAWAVTPCAHASQRCPQLNSTQLNSQLVELS